MMTGISFSVPSTSIMAASGLPPLLYAAAQYTTLGLKLSSTARNSSQVSLASGFLGALDCANARVAPVIRAAATEATATRRTVMVISIPGTPPRGGRSPDRVDAGLASLAQGVGTTR